MEREANYAAVGLFVVLVLAAATLFVYWYAEGLDRRDYARYEIYFQGSVSGLQRGAPVRYLGVDVGRVATMRIDSRDSSRVQVIADIDTTAPVSARTVAELSLQGVTGLLYIDLIEEPGNRPLLESVPSQRYPVIRSARSNLDILLASIPELVGMAADLADRANRMLSDENIAAVGSALANIDRATGRLPAMMVDLEGTAKELRTAIGELSATAVVARTALDQAGPDVARAMERARAAAESLASATARLDEMVAESRADVRSFTRDTLPEFEGLVREGRGAAREVRELARSLRDDPSQLLYQPPAQGVEIPR
jgi:phospholipid/cholesterol/gamma-HCH transport system substrate-binding protein